jgi:type II secretory ATPase GspE/PulE/Tfp pilus assembly ATPase PilB-like protein
VNGRSRAVWAWSKGFPASSSGYKGHNAVHGFLVVTPDRRHHFPVGTCRGAGCVASRHFRPLQHDALRRYWRGETSLAELLALPAPEGQDLKDVLG